MTHLRESKSLQKDLYIRSEKYLAFIRLQPCIKPGCPNKSQPHHFKTGGEAIKCDDTETVPACPECHAEMELNQEQFCRLHGLDLYEIMVTLHIRFLVTRVTDWRPGRSVHEIVEEFTNEAVKAEIRRWK